MSKETLKNEIENISLTTWQKENVKNHYLKVRKRLENLGYSNIQKQGSFGRGTVIRGQESDGFDLDIALVIDNDDTYEANELNFKIKEELEKEYNSTNQTITIGDKAVKIRVKERFGIDVTQIYKNDEEELVYSSYQNNFLDSYALAFRNLFKNKNSNSKDNALRDLCRIFKHIRDSVKDVEIKSLALEILIYKAFDVGAEKYIDSIFNTLRYFETILRDRIKNNKYDYIENPAFQDDHILTGIKTKDQADQIIILCTTVAQVIEAAWVHDKKFHSLERKFWALKDLSNEYGKFSVIPKASTIVKSGTFGGNSLK